MKPTQPFSCSNCGECCGPVPVNAQEVKRIQTVVRRMSPSQRQRLATQKREPASCMFRDVEQNRCTIYSARPEICRAFGFYQGLVCPRNPDHATGTVLEGQKRLFGNTSPIGILSETITWDNLMEAQVTVAKRPSPTRPR